MNREDLKNLKTWFSDYVDRFYTDYPKHSCTIRIKEKHTERVCENIIMLGKDLGLTDQEVILAETMGLFHDIGRFRQLIEFNTFNDHLSLDHADFSVEILKEMDFFQSMDDHSREIIFSAIGLHNKFEIPQNLAPRELLHARILRDADKLDILKVLTDYYTDKNQAPNHTLTWELPVARQVSPGVAREVLSGKLVSKHLVKSDVDVKIMQLSWVYDLNYRFSVSMVLKNRFMERIYGSLPKNDTTIEIYRKIKVYAENKLME